MGSSKRYNRRWHKKLLKARACSRACDWAAKYPTPESAWNACNNPYWMLWVIMRYVHSGKGRGADYRRYARYLAATAARLDPKSPQHTQRMYNRLKRGLPLHQKQRDVLSTTKFQPPLRYYRARLILFIDDLLIDNVVDSLLAPGIALLYNLRCQVTPEPTSGYYRTYPDSIFVTIAKAMRRYYPWRSVRTHIRARVGTLEN